MRSSSLKYDARNRHPLAGYRILVVDDHATVRGVLELALVQAAAEVTTAEDGAAALAQVELKAPDLILLDLMMPNMDGWGVLEQLALRPKSQQIPVILQTSVEDFPSFERAKKYGVAAFISKPFRLNEVVETSRRVIEGARPLQGRLENKQAQPAVSVRDANGPIYAVGLLLDLDEEGAQIETSAPLSLGLQVVIGLPHKGATQDVAAEVRWITNTNDRYQHGLLFKKTNE
ncbi:MAG: response regulator [Vicinamibacteria bacterium]|jgi:CheY-like chemotaxis protein|nr:response regulator [Vicinamibacteria bacterium]